MVSYNFRMPAGVAGEISRNGNEGFVESRLLDSTNPPLAFGVPVKVVNGKMRTIASGDAASVFYGILARTAPAIAGDLSATFQTEVPNVNATQSVVRKGYVKVRCTVGTPPLGGPVYMRVTAASGKAVGDLEATSDGSNSVILPNVTWSLVGKDSDNIAEVYLA